MSRDVRVPVGIAVVLLAAFAAGCGGSGSNGSGSGDTTTAPTGAAERLTTAQWDSYETSRAALKQATATTTATFKKCSATAQQGDAAKWQACVGDVFGKLSTTAGESRTTLESFNGTVSAPCADALADLLNYVGTYQASADRMQGVVDTANLAAYPAASQDLTTSATAGKDQAKAFDKDCAPA